MPNAAILDIASFFNEDRANSLRFRFEQEKQLMEFSAERPFFGWGRYGRNRIYDEHGKDITVTDGAWIITVSQFGLIGFVAQFGLLGLPTFWALRAAKYAPGRDRLMLAGLALIVALCLIEQIPNASVSSWTWFLSGALLGRSQRLQLKSRKAAPERASSIGRNRHNSVAIVARQADEDGQQIPIVGRDAPTKV